MARVADRIKETATTTGTGNFTLGGAVSGFRTFASVFTTGVQIEQFYYCIQHDTLAEWEVGEGYLSAGTTLVRMEVESSSNAGALVNFSAGNKTVFVTMPAYEFQTKGIVMARVSGLMMP